MTKPFRGLLLALLVTATALCVQYALHREEVDKYDRQVLPAFDAYVYMAMADHPSVFTVDPWGYRIVVPWIVHALPLPTAAGYRCVTFGALLGAGALLFLFLRRLGHGETASLVGVAAFTLSPPVGEAVATVILGDPLALAAEIALLLALEAAAPVAVLVLVAVVSMLTKELLLLMLPVVYFARREREGDRGAAAKALLAVAAALGVKLALATWVPYMPSSFGLVGTGVLWLALYRILAGFPDWWAYALVGGLLPVALLGACRAPARPFLRRYGYLVLLTLALPFAVAVYNDDARIVPFHAQDIPRTLLLALPLLVPLALVAVDRVWPHMGEPLPPRTFSPRASLAAATAAVLLLAAPLLACDHYRRLDLRGPHDGRLVLAFCRETLAVAQRLERGKPVAYDPDKRRFSPQRSDPHLLERMRWFLREGWDPMPHYAVGPVIMKKREAVVVVPCLRPADWDVALTLSARQPAGLRVELNGRAVADLAAGPEPARQVVRVPAATLFRGDNLLRLVATSDGEPAARLHQLTIQPVR